MARLLAGILILFLYLDGPALPRGHSVVDPESISGRWETPDGHGGAVGMNVLLTTEIRGGEASFTMQRQTEEQLTVALFQRTGGDVDQLGFNFFTSAADGGADWDGHRLRIQLAGNNRIPGMDVDLVWHPDTESWSGRFERGQFRGNVVLTRSTAGAKVSPFAGTWLNKSADMNNCLHIAQQDGNSFTGWADDIRIPHGFDPARAQTFDRYGEIAKVRLETADWITVQLRAYTGVCCPHSFTAKVSGDGQMLSGNWSARINQTAGVIRFTKMPGKSCVGAGGLDLR